MRKTALIVAAAVLVSWPISGAYACKLKVVGAGEFNKTCKVVIGFANGEKVGAFRLHGTKVGTCHGYLPYSSVSGDTVVVGGTAFKLAQDCKSTNRSGQHLTLPPPNK